MRCVLLFLAVAAVAALRGAETEWRELVTAGSAWTLTFDLEVERYPDGGRGLWDDRSPMTLLRLSGGTDRHALILRLDRKRIQLALPGFKPEPSVTGGAVIDPGTPVAVRLDCDGRVLRLWVNNRLTARLEPGRPFGSWKQLRTGSDLKERRPLAGKVANLNWRAGVVPAGVPGAALPVNLPLDHGYPALQCEKEALHPFIDQLHVIAAAVPWFSAEPRDLLLHGYPNMYGSRLAVYRFLGLSPEGLPVYDAGTTVSELPGSHFQAELLPGGAFRLWARGTNSLFGPQALILLENRGKPGKPEFSDPVEVRIGGKTLRQALDGAGESGFFFGDLDGDGVTDLIAAKCHEPAEGPWPLGEKPWTGRETRYLGRDKGYDVRGRWLGRERVTELLWARGDSVGRGRAEFAAFRPVWFRKPGVPFTWKSGESERALALWRDPDGGRFLLHTGSVDELLAFRFSCQDGEPVMAEPIPFLAAGPEMAETYFALKLNVVDLDGDGRPELLADGNPGKIAVMRGGRAGDFREAGCAVMRGGSLAGETLVSPWRTDLDGDGRPDLLLADASGFLTFWPGTADPLVYGAPVRFTSAGKELHVQAGYSGSIQGPNEKRWGYLKVTAGDWDGDGREELLTGDIEGRLRLYRVAAAPAALGEAREFTLNGRPFRAAWRSRPAVIGREFGYGGEPRAALLLVDWDGDAAVGIPAAAGGVDFKRVEKLRYRDGGVLRMCGVSGQWGRTAMTVADWDGDGRWDILAGSPNGCNAFIMGRKIPTKATVFFLRNTGSNAAPVFERPEPLAGADGALLNFGVHNATPCPADLDGDGRLDLLVGAEDGKVYYFKRNQLKD